jgi:allantoate deiminase
MDYAAQVMERIQELGGISDEPDCLSRPFASPAMLRAHDLVKFWMVKAGMSTRTDAIGNLIGHFPGRQKESKLLLIGSHLDTVRQAGKFDGPLGVLLGIACVAHLNTLKDGVHFGVEVVGFADEEGVRYQTAYLGSRAMAAELAETDLERVDTNGITMAKAITEFGGNPGQLHTCRRARENLLGYAEVHIEQGPVLEQQGHAVGVVTAIAGQTRTRLIFKGQAGHAGTTPMDLRCDALCGAAEFILEIERYARARPGLVATVGQISADPNISNVIPGHCQLTLDVRHQNDPVRITAGEDLMALGLSIGQKRRLEFLWQTVQETASVPCSSELSKLMKKAAKRHQADVVELPSGAGHDAAVIANIAPVAMLFVRCRGGVSHHPDEFTSVEDIRIAFKVLVDFVLSLSHRA